MKPFYLLLFLFISFPSISQAVFYLPEETPREQTEASAEISSGQLDFCCDRDKTNESAHDMSEQEAQEITASFFAPSGSSLLPSVRPRNRPRGSGQR